MLKNNRHYRKERMEYLATEAQMADKGDEYILKVYLLNFF
jgi:hypothetical protein